MLRSKCLSLQAWLAGRRNGAAITMVGVLLLLMACAAPGQNDLTTASDDTDARRRARVYLELAASYLEQGKNTYALDAVKQSLALDSSMYEAHDLRAIIYMRMNEPTLAEGGFRQALALQPKAATVQHNYGWFLCQQGRFNESTGMFSAALANPNYEAKAKTWMAQGLCQAKAGQLVNAEKSLLRANQLDPGNPVVSYNLASRLYAQADYSRAGSYISRVNESDMANSESIWLGIRVARKAGDATRVTALSNMLRQRFAQSKEVGLLDKGQFDE
jgi:type IV pilus assembly protein PilF